MNTHTFTHAKLATLRRRIRTQALDTETKAQLLAHVKHLRSLYEYEVHTSIVGFAGSHSLAYWSEFFKLTPDARTTEVRARLAYARETKVDFHTPPELETFLE